MRKSFGNEVSVSDLARTIQKSEHHIIDLMVIVIGKGEHSPNIKSKTIRTDRSFHHFRHFIFS